MKVLRARRVWYAADDHAVMTSLHDTLFTRLFRFQLTLWLLPLAVLGWLLWRHAAPGGRLTVQYDVNRKTPPALLKNFAPREPVPLLGTTDRNGITERFQEITREPLTFAIPALRQWQRATVRLRYENPDMQPLLHLNIKRPNGTFRYLPFAAFEPRLEMLPAFWVPVRSGALILWQRHPAAFSAYAREEDALKRENKKRSAERERIMRALERAGEEVHPDALPALIDVETAMRAFDLTPYLREPLRYNSVSAFLESPPAIDRILRYNIDPTNLTLLEGYQPARDRTTVRTAVRGRHTITTYVGDNEDLDFQFYLRDSNRNTGGDAITISVVRGTKVLQKETLADDGNTAASGRASDERTVRVFHERPGAGVYHITLATSDDVFLTRFDAQQHMFFFEGHVYVADNEEYRALFPDKEFVPTRLWTDATTLTAATAHENSLQTITVGRRPYTLTAPHENVNVRLSTATSVLLPKNDVYLEGGGFALSEDALFTARLTRPAQFQDTEVNEYDYIIAQYPAPRRLEDGLYEATATIAAPELSAYDGQYVFGISMPGLTERGRRLRVYDVTVTFERTPLTIGNVLSRFRALLTRSPATNASPITE